MCCALCPIWGEFKFLPTDLEKAIDDEDNSESTQIFIPLEWKSCAKSFAFVGKKKHKYAKKDNYFYFLEFIGRQIFGHIYKCIVITVPRSADIELILFFLDIRI